MKRILHVIPKSGGVFDYGQVIGSLYKNMSDVQYEQLAVSEHEPYTKIVETINQSESDIVHFEIGGMQTNFFQASRALDSSSIRQLVTIHDTSIIIARPSGWQLPQGRTPVLIALKVLRKIVDKAVRYTVLAAWLKNQDIHFIVLREHSIPGAEYLPQATYLKKAPSKVNRPHKPFRYGFAGYWSRNKGLDTLLAAFTGLDKDAQKDTELVLYGGGFSGEDPFITSINEQASKHANVKLPGLIPSGKMNQTLRSLDVIVLPYWFNNPAGASAIAMRAAELGVPVVASKAPQLVEALGEFATYYEPDRSEESLRQALIDVRESYDLSLRRANMLQVEVFQHRSHVVIQLLLAKILDSI